MPVPPRAFSCSATELAFAAFEREGEGLVLTEHRTRELPEGTFQRGPLGGPPREPRSFEETVASFVDGLETVVDEASLVLPDAWLRTAFTEISDLPSGSKGRDDVLRWKLKRLVPFRVDELRVRAAEVAPLAGQSEPRRLLLGFGIESLLSHLEHAFRSAGVTLGRIANRGLSATGALLDGDRAGAALNALVLASENGYTLVVTRADEPVLHRCKSFPDELPEAARRSAVGRDLRLTGTFLEEHFPDAPLARVVLGARPGAAPWPEWVEEGLGREVEVLAPEHTVPLRAGSGELPPRAELLPLVGTVCQEATT